MNQRLIVTEADVNAATQIIRALLDEQQGPSLSTALTQHCPIAIAAQRHFRTAYCNVDGRSGDWILDVENDAYLLDEQGADFAADFDTFIAGETDRPSAPGVLVLEAV